MNENSYLCKYINNHPNWEEELSAMGIKIKIENNLAIFNYDMLSADWTRPEVREARGIIIDLDFLEVVRIAFNKFFNVDEEYAAEIDWASAKVQEKVDGSLMSLYFHMGSWHLASMSMINAGKPFNSLFWRAFKNQEISLSLLNPSCTYTFELVDPATQVVVLYPFTKIYHTGTRNNYTLKEINSDIGCEKPAQYNLSTLAEVREAANQLNVSSDAVSAEGFVVVDKNYSRIKIKSPKYVEYHHMRGNGVPSYKTILNLIQIGEDKEFLSYFPSLKPYFNSCKEKINAFREELRIKIDGYIVYYNSIGDIKNYGQWIKNKEYGNLTWKMIKENWTFEEVWKHLDLKKYIKE